MKTTRLKALWNVLFAIVVIAMIAATAWRATEFGISIERELGALRSQNAAYKAAIANYDRQAEQFREKVERLEAENAGLRERQATE